MAYKFNNNTKSRNSKKKCKLSSKYSRKKIYGGTNKFIQDNITELDRLREYSKRCADNPTVKLYIKETLELFIDLLKNYHSIEKIKIKYSELTKSTTTINDSGFVNVEDFDKVLGDGNLREQMSMMIILLVSFKDIFIRLIINKNLREPRQILQVNNNSILLNLIENRVMKYLGFKNISQLMNYYMKCGMCGIDYTLLSLSESNIPARYSGFPMSPTRVKREHNSIYNLDTTILYPPLSCMEKRFLFDRQNNLNEITTTSPISEDSCPNINKLIKSGANYYTINKASSFYRLCVVYNHYIVSGPSGSTDQLFHIFGIFNNFNVDLFILSCIAYMGSTPDHSIFEILLPSITYGSNYDSTINEYTFVNDILSNLEDIQDEY